MRKGSSKLTRRIELTENEHRKLARISRKCSAPYREVIRAKIVLMANRGLSHREIARRLNLGRNNVRSWIRRYLLFQQEELLPQSNKRAPETDQRITRLLAILSDQLKQSEPTAALSRLAITYRKHYGISLSKSSISRLINKSEELMRLRHEIKSLPVMQPETYGKILTPTERQKLNRTARHWTAPHHEVMRAKIVLLADQGLSHQEISRRLDLDRKIVSKWKRRYLLDRTVRSRPKMRPISTQRKEAREQRRKRILDILHDRPSAHGINRASWSLDALSAAYRKRYDENMSRTFVHRLIKVSGYSFKKARRVLTSPDPDYREKVELLLKTLRALGPDEYLFFIDEMGPLRMKKYGGRSHVPKHQVTTFPQVQSHKGAITMSAALNATKNQITWLYSQAKDTQAMIDLIEILFNQYHDAKRIYVTWDAASWHRSAGLLEWLDIFNSETKTNHAGPSITLLPLPRSAQFLDVIEAVFSGLKRAVIHHSDYSSTTEMKGAISKHFCDRNAHFELNPKRAGKKIWEIDFFEDCENIKSGTYREW